MKYPLPSLLAGIFALGAMQAALGQTTQTTSTTSPQSATVMTSSGPAPAKPSLTTTITPGQADFKMFAEKPKKAGTGGK